VGYNPFQRFRLAVMVIAIHVCFGDGKKRNEAKKVGNKNVVEFFDYFGKKKKEGRRKFFMLLVTC